MKTTRLNTLSTLQTLLFLVEVILMALFCAIVLPCTSGIWSALCAVPITLMAIAMVITCMVPVRGQYTGT